MKNLEFELQIAEYSLQEASESFTQLREDYHALRVHTDLLEELLEINGIDFPEFQG